jgi:hypothetical protein
LTVNRTPNVPASAKLSPNTRTEVMLAAAGLELAVEPPPPPQAARAAATKLALSSRIESVCSFIEFSLNDGMVEGWRLRLEG